MLGYWTARFATLALGFALAFAYAGAADAQDSYSGSQYDVYREAPDPDAGAADSRYGTPTQGPSNRSYSNGGGYSGDGGGQSYGSGEAYRPNNTYGSNDTYRSNDAYQSPQSGGGYGSGSAYNNGPDYGSRTSRYDSGGRDYRDNGRYDSGPGQYADEPYDDRAPRNYPQDDGGGTYSQNEILGAGHQFFGSVSKGLANVIEYAFKQSGRPNGYILGEDAGGAFVAGLRYGEGRLHTRRWGTHKVYWQGPSVGYDFGGDGSKTMVLVYNMRDPSDIYHRFGGVQGSAYVVGGVGIQFQTYEHVTMAPIRAGVGLRLGANIGYLKYTRSPTWNPF